MLAVWPSTWPFSSMVAIDRVDVVEGQLHPLAHSGHVRLARRCVSVDPVHPGQCRLLAVEVKGLRPPGRGGCCRASGRCVGLRQAVRYRPRHGAQAPAIMQGRAPHWGSSSVRGGAIDENHYVHNQVSQWPGAFVVERGPAQEVILNPRHPKAGSGRLARAGGHRRRPVIRAGMCEGQLALQDEDCSADRCRVRSVD